jgi:hypothetical protein
MPAQQLLLPGEEGAGEDAGMLGGRIETRIEE